MPTATPSSTPSDPAPHRLLSGAGGGGREGSRTGTVTQATTFTATVPHQRPQVHPVAPVAAEATQGVPRWAKGVVIGGILLAVGMPASVLMSRSMLVQSALMAESSSKAAMVCTGGEGRAIDGSSLTGWLFGGSYFSCGDWETREARQQRERELAHNAYMARQKARQMGQ